MIGIFRRLESLLADHVDALDEADGRLGIPLVHQRRVACEDDDAAAWRTDNDADVRQRRP